MILNQLLQELALFGGPHVINNRSMVKEQFTLKGSTIRIYIYIIYIYINIYVPYYIPIKCYYTHCLPPIFVQSWVETHHLPGLSSVGSVLGQKAGHLRGLREALADFGEFLFSS